MHYFNDNLYEYLKKNPNKTVRSVLDDMGPMRKAISLINLGLRDVRIEDLEKDEELQKRVRLQVIPRRN